MNILETVVRAFEWINPYLWGTGNIVIAYIGVFLLLFVSSYQWLFDPRATTGGRLIFRFGLSLTFVMALVVIGVYIDPRDGLAWFEYPTDLYWWLPAVRLVIYVYVAYTITSLVVFLYIRKFKPSRIRAVSDKLLVEPRTHTGPNWIKKEDKHV